MDSEYATNFLRTRQNAAEWWNQRIEQGKEIPCLAGADLSGSQLQGINFSDMDLSGVNLNEASLDNANLSGAILTGAQFKSARLFDTVAIDADLSGANLTRAKCLQGNFARANFNGATLDGAGFGDADLTEAILTSAHLTGTVFVSAKLLKCNLTGASAQNCGMKGVQLQGATLQDANLTRANLEDAIADETTSFRGACLEESRLDRARVTNCCLSGVNLYRASLMGTDISGAEIEDANFTEANIERTNFTEVRGAQSAIGLESTVNSEQARYFDKCHRSWVDKNADWERIRVIGNLKLFGVSYTLVLFLLTFFYVVGRYNEKVEILQNWATEIEASGEKGSQKILARQVDEKLTVFKVSLSSVALLVSTLILVAASIIYTLACPDEVKDFTRAQWCYQLKQSLVHYWAFAWQNRCRRVVCAILYLVGGVSFVVLTLIKLIHAVNYILQYVDV